MPATLASTLFGMIGGTAQTRAPGDVGICVQVQPHDDLPTGSFAETTGRWSPRQPSDS